MVGGAPLVIKLIEGTQGIGVILAETDKAAQAVIEAFRGLDANILVQEFIKEAQGSATFAVSSSGKGGGGDAAARAPWRLPFQSPPRRHGRAGQAHARGAQHRHPQPPRRWG
jgi:hypothetical protein